MSRREGSEHPREILRRAGLAARRRLGQSFLVSPAVIDRVVEEARVAPSDVVLEIGTGLGRLTRRLAQRAAVVVSVEIDRGLCEIARERLRDLDNVTLLHEDFLAGKHRINPAVTEAVRVAAGARPVRVVGNLPYQISSPALINLLEWEVPVTEMDVTLQAEVVERLRAAPGTSQYGPLTVFAAYRSETEELFSLSPRHFWPAPAVRSCFVRLTPRPPCPRAESYQTFALVVNKLLQNRRKTLFRALALAWQRDCAKALLEELGLDASMRPDRLTPGDFVTIANALDARGRPDGLH